MCGPIIIGLAIVGLLFLGGISVLFLMSVFCND